MECHVLIDQGDCKGEAPYKSNAGWIKLESYSIGCSQAISNPAGSEGLAAQAADVRELSVVKEVDKASPGLFGHCCAGTKIPKVTLEVSAVQNNENKVFKTITMEECMIASVSDGGGKGGDAKPMEEVSIACKKIEYKYTTLEGGSNFVKKYDIATRKLS